MRMTGARDLALFIAACLVVLAAQGLGMLLTGAEVDIGALLLGMAVVLAALALEARGRE
jgi:hypothetical protein